DGRAARAEEAAGGRLEGVLIGEQVVGGARLHCGGVLLGEALDGGETDDPRDRADDQEYSPDDSQQLGGDPLRAAVVLFCLGGLVGHWIWLARGGDVVIGHSC